MRLTAYNSRHILAPCSLEGRNYQIDPYVGCAHLCHYCYALNDATFDWSKEIMHHADLEGTLARDLKGTPPQTVYMGWKTDPYQPCEAKYLQTRKALELLAEHGCSASILTKSDLVLRDLDILRSMKAATVSLSIAFDLEQTRASFEANTKATETRINALKECKEAGLRTTAMICPVIPYISNPLSLFERVRGWIDKVWVYGLSIHDESDVNWRNVEKILMENHPQRHQAVKAAVFDRNHHYWPELRESLTSSPGNNVALSIHF